ncbi:MAG: nitroreductase family protein [Thermoflexales bacterium]|nr:nitroreductase family protein [Thermoflexales bacterium]
MHPLIETILSRRTIRKYKAEPLPAEDREQIIACAQRAPTGGGLQVYSLVRVTDAGLRAQIAHLAGDQAHVREAAEFFVVCADVHRDRALIAHRGGQPGVASVMSLLYGCLDATIAASFMGLAAEALGYGTCFIGGIQNALDEIARLLALPEGVLPVVGLCIGRPAEQPEQRPRMPLDVIVHENAYGQLTPDDLDRCYAAQAAASSSGDWFRTVNRYLGAGGVMDKREPIARQTLAQQGLWPCGPGT